MLRHYLIGIGLLIIVIIGGGFAFVYSGIYNVAASSPDNPVVAWLLHTTYEHSMARRSSVVVVPAGLETPAAVRAGAIFFAQNCAVCHGAPGEARTSISQGLRPQPPFLLAQRRKNEPAQLFWVVKNGINMTAMPAFGKTQPDSVIWQIAAFLQADRGISAADFRKLIQPPAQSGG